MTVFINIMYVKFKFANGKNDKVAERERKLSVCVLCNIIYK